MGRDIKDLRTVKLIDEETGEVLSRFPTYFPPKLKLYGWFMVWQNGLDRLAEDKEITGVTLRVLLKMLAHLDYENYTNISQAEISRELSISKSLVSRSVKQLLDKGIIIKANKIGNVQRYRLNELYGWKGKMKNMVINGGQ